MTNAPEKIPAEKKLAVPEKTSLALLGKKADQIAAEKIFSRRDRKTANTRAADRIDINTFERYLGEIGVSVENSLLESPQNWAGIGFGLVEGFYWWLRKKGYATASINRKLSTVRVYAKMALGAGVLSAQEFAQIDALPLLGSKAGRNVDEQRIADGLPTRLSTKKERARVLSGAEALALKEQPPTPQGRRDRLLICLLLDLGLRAGELAALCVENFDLATAKITFYRQKVDKEQTFVLPSDTAAALRAYLSLDALEEGPILRRSGRTGRLNGAGMSRRAITARVKLLGANIGIEGLSAHDLRHTCITHHARGGVDALRLQEFGGWNSMAMVRRYVEATQIANEGLY